MRLQSSYKLLRGLAALALFPFLLQTPADAGEMTLNERLVRIEAAMEKVRISEGVAGLSFAIVVDGRVVMVKGLGYAQAGKPQPVTPDTLFPIASMTKAFTAMALATAADEKLLSLDDAPGKYLPYARFDNPKGGIPVTIRHMLSHTTGLPTSHGGLLFSLWPSKSLLRRDLADPQVAPAGQKWQYHNAAYEAAGEILARVDQTTWEQSISWRLLQPLGMKATRFTRLESDEYPYAEGHSVISDPAKGKKPVLESYFPMDSFGGAGAMISNARDMGRWLEFLLNRGIAGGQRVVRDEVFDQVFERFAVKGEGFHYGLGWDVIDKKGTTFIQHGGNAADHSSFVFMVPARRLGYVILINQRHSLVMNPMANELLRYFPSDYHPVTYGQPSPELPTARG